MTLTDQENAEVILRAQASLITDNFLTFTRALVNAGAFDSEADLLYFLEKPWKWSTAYAVWTANGRPTNDESPEDVAGWRRFLEALEIED